LTHGDGIDGFSAYYQNVRGIRTKLKTLTCNVPLNEYSAIIFTETWLIPSIKTSEIGLDNYNIYRCDRDRTDVTRGGGVLIAVNKCFKSKRIVLNSSLEILFVLVNIKSKDVVISTVYLPPNSIYGNYQEYTDTLDTIIRKHKGAVLMLTGDFNLPNITWDPNTLEPHVMITNPITDTLINAISFHSLTRYHKEILC
jgi:Endonuclease/Exonuclease/phosphatase family.